ncbi:MAG: glycine cleavage system aminomethyltransferase GcvT [Caldibacillus debilis]|uniref:Aminomethyltransferase n=1 Tax=Caldibacillus debilis TaxID=301148 RepID=A0A3E0K8P5_9BACI|nr:glycine cleavage system aminomethyltransferase GcvT [Caldibacillus debilis]MBY6272253.1 glycine cleavage system protein T [Bacillaceae bacterium]REJ14648.1 MAG: glycine cleavage system aminomethyltransferase GcvT [Caldibacillus debilis]REJ31589.1 MAG: glycine cleavage system aminomethyltransferase GcvT [Caldibacillus debilis]
MSALKRTPLFPLYADFGAKTIDFGGWELPVQFSGIMKEHEAVRNRAGLFDVSHMGEILVSGEDAYPFLQRMLTNDLSRLKIGKAQYTLMANERGGTVDDLLVYRLGEREFLLVVNAANTEKDERWLTEHKTGDVAIENLSSRYAQLALQGPLAEKVLQKLAEDELSALPFFGFRKDVSIGGVKALVSRTGYTGEDGFEIYLPPDEAPNLWRMILEAGAEEGVVPCGLGARDTLRFEACLPLYGQELSETISPLEAGLAFAVKVNKAEDFIGKAALAKELEEGPKRKIAGIEMLDKGVPRHGYRVLKDGREIGHITTGTHSPTLKKNIGLALIERDAAVPDTELEVEIRGKCLRARTVSTPFYKRNRQG